MRVGVGCRLDNGDGMLLGDFVGNAVGAVDVNGVGTVEASWVGDFEGDKEGIPDDANVGRDVGTIAPGHARLLIPSSTNTMRST